MCITLYIVSTNQEEEKEVVAESLVSLAELIKADKSILTNNMEEFMEFLSRLFEEATLCQNPDDDELKEAKMATEENLILDGLTEVVTALTHVLTADQLAE